MGARWDFIGLVENHDIDFVPCTRCPTSAAITENDKVAALCETAWRRHCPAFSPADSTAAQVGCLSTFSGPCDLRVQLSPLPYLPECWTSKNGRPTPTNVPVWCDTRREQVKSLAKSPSGRPGASSTPPRTFRPTLVVE